MGELAWQPGMMGRKQPCSGSNAIMLNFASQVIVQKQQVYLGAKRTPPGKSGRALQLPRACTGCGRFTTCTGHGVTSQNDCSKTTPPTLISRYQTKPLQWDSVVCDIILRLCLSQCLLDAVTHCFLVLSELPVQQYYCLVVAGDNAGVYREARREWVCQVLRLTAC
jgi:hypothetical protein